MMMPRHAVALCMVLATVASGEDASLHEFQDSAHPAAAVGEWVLRTVYAEDNAGASLRRHSLSNEELGRRLQVQRRLATTDVEFATKVKNSMTTAGDKIRLLAALHASLFPQGCYWQWENSYPDLFNGVLRPTKGDAAAEGDRVTSAMTSFQARVGANVSPKFMPVKNAPTVADEKVLTKEQCDEAYKVVALKAAVYENGDGVKVLLFRGSFTDTDYTNMQVWETDFMRDRLGSKFEMMWEEAQSLMTDATQKASFPNITEMRKRKNSMKHKPYVYDAGFTAAGAAMNYPAYIKSLTGKGGMSWNDAVTKGLYEFAQQILIQESPDRDVSKIDASKMLLSGYSQGGMQASLLSMWLKQKKSKIVTTINLAGVGVRCMAGRFKLDGTQSNPQITNYVHPLDGFAAIDVQPGKVCKYGGNRLSSTPDGKDLVSVFSTAVGYTGGQLIAGKGLGEPVATNAFTASRFWSHSPLYASQVLGKATIDNDGAVDGATCTTTPASDMERWCPSLQTYPALLFNPPQEINPCLKGTGVGGADLEYSFLKVVTLPKGTPFQNGGSCLVLGKSSYFIFVHMSSNKSSNGYIGVHFRYKTTLLGTFEGNTAFAYKSLKTRLRTPYLRFSQVKSKVAAASTYALKAGTKICTKVGAAANARTCVSLGNEGPGRRLGSAKSSPLLISAEVEGVSGASKTFELADVSGDGQVASRSTVTASKGDGTSGFQTASKYDDTAAEAQVIAGPTAAPVTTTAKTSAAKPTPKPATPSDVSPKPTPKPASEPAAATKITAVITLKGLDFDKVSKNVAVMNKLKTSIKAIFLKALGDNVVQDLLVTLSKGSVKAQVDITPKPGASVADLTASVTAKKDGLATAVLKQAKVMPEVKDGSMLETGKTINDLAAFGVVNDPRTGTPSRSAPIEGAVVDGAPNRGLIWLSFCAASWVLW